MHRWLHFSARTLMRTAVAMAARVAVAVRVAVEAVVAVTTACQSTMAVFSVAGVAADADAVVVQAVVRAVVVVAGLAAGTTLRSTAPRTRTSDVLPMQLLYTSAWAPTGIR